MWRLVGGVLIALLPLVATAQVTQFKYDSGYSFRDVMPGTDNCTPPMCTYHTIQTWGNDSPIKQYTYRGLNAEGYVIEFMNWRMLFPVGYNKFNAEKYPMIVMLHGAGQSGRLWSGNFAYGPADVEYDNNDASLVHGGKEHQIAAGWSHVTGQPLSPTSFGPLAFPGVVVWPQASYNAAWENGWANGAMADNNRMVVQIIEWVINQYDIDPDRVSIHGLSHGAQGALDLAAKRPDLFAAILPMSGIATNCDLQTNILVTTPIWIFQGGRDTNPAPQASLDMKNMFAAKGAKPVYTLYPSVGHETWVKAFVEPDFFPFMLRANKKNISVFCSDSSCEQLPIKLGVSAGYASYQWTKNGNDIPSATTRFYEATTKGVYAVKMKRQPTVGGGGTVTSNPVEIGTPDVITGISEPALSVAAFPNPFRDKIVVTLPAKVYNGMATLTDMMGQPVESVSFTSTDTGEAALNFGAAQAGAYVLRVGEYRFKVVKE